MPGGRPTVLTPAIVSKIADCFLVAFTDQQTADYCGIDEKTIRKIRLRELFPAVKIAELEREMKYRKKIWAAKGFWQGAAWFLERKYPHQFSSPAVQLQFNSNSVTNNTLVITAEVASTISKRRKEVESKVEKLYKDRRKRTQLPLRDANGNGEDVSGQEPQDA
jgi:hypothetical protein